MLCQTKMEKKDNAWGFGGVLSDELAGLSDAEH
jgi:hypothetical protein